DYISEQKNLLMLKHTLGTVTNKATRDYATLWQIGTKHGGYDLMPKKYLSATERNQTQPILLLFSELIISSLSKIPSTQCMWTATLSPDEQADTQRANTKISCI